MMILKQIRFYARKAPMLLKTIGPLMTHFLLIQILIGMQLLEGLMTYLQERKIDLKVMPWKGLKIIQTIGEKDFLLIIRISPKLQDNT